MRKLYQFVSISLVIGLTLSIIFSYINAGGEYYPISPVTTLGKLYYSHLSEPIVMLIAICSVSYTHLTLPTKRIV